jgi:hypothetical protein
MKRMKEAKDLHEEQKNEVVLWPSVHTHILM